MKIELKQYFPFLTDLQVDKLERLAEIFPKWNERINLVSRKDIDNLMEAHIMHSLAISRFVQFISGSKVMDLGCGGGFPGIPLAIVFPDTHFHLIDRIGKKVRAATEIADELGVKNVSFQHGDSGECKEIFDFVVSRAVMPQADLIKAVRRNISHSNVNAIPNGLISLKGGNLSAELQNVHNKTEVFSIHDWIPTPFFETKKLVYTILA